MFQENPEHPDWVPAFSAFELGRIMAQRGDRERAKELWNRVLADTRTGYLHDEAKKMLADLDHPPAATGPGPADAEAIYGNEAAARQRVLASLAAIQNPTIADQFYLGEAHLMSGDAQKALDAYTGAINPKACAWDHCYQMVAATRAGEILASRGGHKLTASATKPRDVLTRNSTSTGCQM
jgi:tetratricopeptide (TPR) repeat protein